tara:strand:- start:1092 stop:1280 length:189 start_codon:yes stop_codon:yes gene_type:complete
MNLEDVLRQAYASAGHVAGTVPPKSPEWIEQEKWIRKKMAKASLTPSPSDRLRVLDAEIVED